MISLDRNAPCKFMVGVTMTRRNIKADKFGFENYQYHWINSLWSQNIRLKNEPP